MFAVVCLTFSNAMAAAYSLVPSDRDLGDLNHYRHYTWGIDTPWSIVPDINLEYEQVTSATLSFNDIRNWDDKPNVLYIHLLDDASLGVAVGYDGQGGGDNFDGDGTTLTIYQNLPSTSQDLSYSFTDNQIDALNSYASDGRFALGFDPDCHFYNRGVSLDIHTEMVSTPVVPEPATLVLLAIGGLTTLRRRRQTA
jgi:hypothetical protein